MHNHIHAFARAQIYTHARTSGTHTHIHTQTHTHKYMHTHTHKLCTVFEVGFTFQSLGNKWMPWRRSLTGRRSTVAVTKFRGNCAPSIIDRVGLLFCLYTTFFLMLINLGSVDCRVRNVSSQSEQIRPSYMTYGLNELGHCGLRVRKRGWGVQKWRQRVEISLSAP